MADWTTFKKIIEEFVDTKGLGKAIHSEAKGVNLGGLGDFKPSSLVTMLLLDILELELSFKLVEQEAEEAKSKRGQ